MKKIRFFTAIGETIELNHLTKTVLTTTVEHIYFLSSNKKAILLFYYNLNIQSIFRCFSGIFSLHERTCAIDFTLLHECCFARHSYEFHAVVVLFNESVVFAAAAVASARVYNAYVNFVVSILVICASKWFRIVKG